MIAMAPMERSAKSATLEPMLMSDNTDVIQAVTAIAVVGTHSLGLTLATDRESGTPPCCAKAQS